MTECDRCDGCGWYEGGPTLKTSCEKCNGTGVVGERGGLTVKTGQFRKEAQPDRGEAHRLMAHPTTVAILCPYCRHPFDWATLCEPVMTCPHESAQLARLATDDLATFKREFLASVQLYADVEAGRTCMGSPIIAGNVLAGIAKQFDMLVSSGAPQGAVSGS